MVPGRSILYMPNKYPEPSSPVLSLSALAMGLTRTRFFHNVNSFWFRHGTFEQRSGPECQGFQESNQGEDRNQQELDKRIVTGPVKQSGRLARFFQSIELQPGLQKQEISCKDTCK